MKDRIEKITLDLSFISLVGLKISEVMTLFKIFFDDVAKQHFDYKMLKEDIENLEEKRFIKIINDGETTERYILRVKGKDLIEKLTNVSINMEGDRVIETKNLSSVQVLVREIRSKFRGLKTGSMGDKTALETKIERWKSNNPEVTDQQILDAVDRYIESHNGDYRFLQRADYFVYKQNNHKDESSRLSIFIEELEEPQENTDWGTELI